MTFDELQKTWQSHEGGFRPHIDPDMLLKEVKRNKRYFESAILWRDVREAGASLLAFILFLYFYFVLKGNLWPLLLLALVALGVGIFMMVDRIVQKRKCPKLTESFVSCIESYLAQVGHQIWLLKNVLWWYLLPPGIGLVILIVYFAWKVCNLRGMGLIFSSVYFVFCAVFFWGVYHLNQWVVRKELVPRQQELEQLLHSLKNADG